MPREVRQVSFAGGEITPALQARTDLAKYFTSLKTCRNFFVTQHGILMNRPGTRFVHEVKDSTKPVRLIPFIFNNEQTFVLEFGAGYIRFYHDGAIVVGPGTTHHMAAIEMTQVFGDGQILEVTTPYEASEEWAIDTQFNIYSLCSYAGRTWQSIKGTPIPEVGLINQGNEPAEGSEWWRDVTAWTGDLNRYKFVQMGDVITIVHPLYAPRELRRLSNSEWSLMPITVTRAAGPTGLGFRTYPSNVRGVNPTCNYATYDENYTYQGGYTCVMESTEAGPNNGLWRSLQDGNKDHHPHDPANVGVWWTLEVEAAKPTIPLPTINHLDSPGRPARDWRWVVTAVDENGVESLPSATPLNPNSDVGNLLNSDKICLATDREVKITWAEVVGTRYYNVYRGRNGLYGYVGESATNSFTDEAQAPDYTITPPTDSHPFETANDYPSTVAYYQQRRWYGGTINDPQTIWGSKTGDYNNFDVAQIPKADDAVSFTLASRQLESIRNLVGLRTLLLLTSSGEWALSGGQGGPVTPSNVEIQPHGYRGSSFLDPIAVGNVTLFTQAMGNVIRELVYDFSSDSYGGADLTVLATHLFQGHRIVDWCYAPTPYSILWAVREDGRLLGCTYLREHEVVAWHQHDMFEDPIERVCAVPEGVEHAVYVVVQRGAKRYVERFTTRQQIPRLADDTLDVKRGVFLDSSLSYEGDSTTVFAGLDHLEGRDVMVLADGNVCGPYRVGDVAPGTIDISEQVPDGATVVHVGLSYWSEAETLDLASQQGDSRAATKNVFVADVEVIDSRGLKVGVIGDEKKEWRQRRVLDSWGAVAPYDGFIEVRIPSSYSRDARLVLRQEDPLPVTITGIGRKADVT